MAPRRLLRRRADHGQVPGRLLPHSPEPAAGTSFDFTASKTAPSFPLLNVLLKSAKKPSNNPLQLVAVVCANLAGKTRRCPDFASWERKLRVYADHSVTAKEVQVRARHFFSFLGAFFAS